MTSRLKYLGPGGSGCWAADVWDSGHVACVQPDWKTRDRRDQCLQDHADEHQHPRVGQHAAGVLQHPSLHPSQHSGEQQNALSKLMKQC